VAKRTPIAVISWSEYRADQSRLRTLPDICAAPPSEAIRAWFAAEAAGFLDPRPHYRR